MCQTSPLIHLRTLLFAFYFVCDASVLVDSSLEDLRLRLMRSGVSYVPPPPCDPKRVLSTVLLFFLLHSTHHGALDVRTHIHRVSRIHTEGELTT